MPAGPTGLIIFYYKKESWEQLYLVCSIHKMKTLFWLLVTKRNPKPHLSTLWLLLSCLVWISLLFSFRCPLFVLSSPLLQASFTFVAAIFCLSLQPSFTLVGSPLFAHFLFHFAASFSFFFPPFSP